MVSAAVDGGKLMGYFNLPWFAWGSAEMNLGDTVEYNTLVRVTSPYDRLATAIIKLFVHHNVRSTIRFYSDYSVGVCGVLASTHHTIAPRVQTELHCVSCRSPQNVSLQLEFC